MRVSGLGYRLVTSGGRLAAAIVCLGAVLAPARPAPAVPRGSYATAAGAAVVALERRWFRPPGRWEACVPGACGTLERDWGADALTATLVFRRRVANDRNVDPFLVALAAAAPTYGDCRRPTCSQWSDVPMWDSVIAARIALTGVSPVAVQRAVRAFALVDRSDAFALGACPAIRYQQPSGGGNRLKTLETDANYIRAALLLRRLTGEPAYLRKALRTYAAARRYFLDSRFGLYTVYVFDDGTTCKQLPRRFFASVNGIMIENGRELWAQTHDAAYARDALATARAAARELADPAGVFADLQAENDIVEPLVEAFYDMATDGHEAFARHWLLGGAAVARPAADGAYGRFFDGPPPPATVSAWAASGGIALAIAAGALAPGGRPAPAAWAAAHFVADPIAAAPATIAFIGRGIALIGTLGDRCCEAGHVRVFVDGRETADRTGIWQNKSSASRPLTDSILFAWRWPARAAHTITLEPGAFNPKEGGSYVHLRGYEVIP